ncbi:MAG: ion transporter [Pseudomonadota bacterium]
MTLQKTVYKQLAPEARRSGISVLNLCVIGLVLFSFLLLALETESSIMVLPSWALAISTLNILIVLIFAIEYAMRVWVAGVNSTYRGFRGRLRYMRSTYAIADLLAFLPELIVMVFGLGISITALRVFRLFRLIKIARFVPAFAIFGSAIRRSGSQLLTALAIALALVYIAAVALYFVEGIGGQQQEDFSSIPRAIWWAVATLTTVGYGDVYPVTALGRFFASIIALAGIGVVALPAGVFASAFTDELRDREDKRGYKEGAEDA